ncbi:hypothetical protein B9Z55_021070 [Caenorhabditis nigoni]|uniref:Lin-15A/B-like domain-containing protein n=1 Tax=Caenorhabditis nigoni TaxID=1611254 RepID=A0A2G5TQD8_9PELO|nr:hypothetical protein B9Z55_021070 [Caenorhabditis nigoni]
MVIMIGCILRGTHSFVQAKSSVTTYHMYTCYSHLKESIDMIFAYFEVGSVQEFSKCSSHAMNNLMNIVKNFDSNYTKSQLLRAFNTLFTKTKMLPSKF